ncbi:unnamed protein product [Linum trigynum]|uniref:Uncharacterized protein n=1 Tax=Linum trigynum TaxID=586398 RepID=A0AAV2D995_9ROSI
MEKKALFLKIPFFTFILLTASVASSSMADVETGSYSSRKVGRYGQEIAGVGRTTTTTDAAVCKKDEDCLKYCPPVCKDRPKEIQCSFVGNCFCSCIT